jgi:hypothetical protein
MKLHPSRKLHETASPRSARILRQLKNLPDLGSFHTHLIPTRVRNLPPSLYPLVTASMAAGNAHHRKVATKSDLS